MNNSIINFSNISLITGDNIRIAANYYNNDNKSIVIIAPGWCMTKDSDAFKKISECFSKSFDVLSIDFRGHGKSGGFYTFGAKEIQDIDAAVKFADKYENIFLMGFSLGGMISLLYCVESNRIKAVISVSPPADFSKIENQMWKKEAWGETFKKFELERFLSVRPSIVPHVKLKPIDVIEKIKCPTLFIAGKKDPTVHFWHTKALFDKAQCKKDFKLFENGIHAEDIFLHFKEEFTELCFDWLSKI